MEVWPNFFIVGAPKAGTTSLYAYLKDIPRIFMSQRKEPHYFSCNVVSEKSASKPIRNKKKYLKLFEKAKEEKIIGEASVTYLADPEAPKLIHEVAPQARILISLRDPINRLFSSYLMQGPRMGRLKLSFSEELRITLEQTKRNQFYDFSRLLLKFGLYSESVKRYLDIFGKEQVKIIFFEEFIKNPKSTLMDILNFLDINYTLDDFKPKIHNPYSVARSPISQLLFRSKTAGIVAKKIFTYDFRRFLKEQVLVKNDVKPEIDERDKEILFNYYKDDVKKLQTILCRTLPWQNFKKMVP